MEANEFINEVYRRMSLKRLNNVHYSEQEFLNSKESKQTATHLKNMLPEKKDAKILEIGYGTGFFISACVQLGYTNIYGADFHNDALKEIEPKIKSIKKLYNIEKNIWDTLLNIDEKFDFIYLSHVIEHIPKYNLFDVIDSIYNALNISGVLFVRCPNMISYGANSSLYVTLGHEYGFTRDNLGSLLHISGFDDIKSYNLPINFTLKNKIGTLLKVPFLWLKLIQNRLFGVHSGKYYDSELVMSGKKNHEEQKI